LSQLTSKLWPLLRHPNRPVSHHAFFWMFFLLILGASSGAGQLSLTGLAVLLGFVLVMKVALIPLSPEFLVRFQFYVRAMRWLLGFMALSAMVSLLVGPYTLGRHTPVIYQFLSTVIILGWTLLVMVFLFSAKQVVGSTLFAGLAVYLLLAASWAEMFELLQMIQVGSFEPPLATRGTSSSLFDLDSLYLSLSSLTTLGIASIKPIRPVACLMVTMEAAVGNVYLAVMIARLVALHKSLAKPASATIPPRQARRVLRLNECLIKQSSRVRRRSL
jgi:hypothetical protein